MDFLHFSIEIHAFAMELIFHGFHGFPSLEFIEFQVSMSLHSHGILMACHCTIEHPVRSPAHSAFFAYSSTSLVLGHVDPVSNAFPFTMHFHSFANAFPFYFRSMTFPMHFQAVSLTHAFQLIALGFIHFQLISLISCIFIGLPAELLDFQARGREHYFPYVFFKGLGCRAQSSGQEQ